MSKPLEDAFAAPPKKARGAGLSAFRPERRQSTPAPASPRTDAPASAAVVHPVVTDETAASPVTDSPSPTSVPSAPESTPPPVADAADADGLDIKSVTVYVDQATLRALKAETGKGGITYADVAERALAGQLDAVRALFAQDPATVVGVMPGRPRRHRIRGGIPIQLQFTIHQRRWLDEQTAQIGAPNRSVMVVRALQLELGVPVE